VVDLCIFGSVCSLQLFTLMADFYQNSIKDTNNSAKRWAYEIYSTFLTPSAVSIGDVSSHFAALQEIVGQSVMVASLL